MIMPEMQSILQFFPLKQGEKDIKKPLPEGRGFGNGQMVS